MRTTSGASSRQRATASSPAGRAATSSMPASRTNSNASASENISWSSTTRTRSMPAISTDTSALGRRHLKGDPRAPDGVFDIPLGSARVRRVHWKGFRWTFLIAQPRVERRSIGGTDRKSNAGGGEVHERPYLRTPGRITVLLRPTRSPATHSRQTSSPFPPARTTVPTSTGVGKLCCTGNYVRRLRGSRDTQRGARLLPWSCDTGHTCHSRGEPHRPPSSRGG